MYPVKIGGGARAPHAPPPQTAYELVERFSILQVYSNPKITTLGLFLNCYLAQPNKLAYIHRLRRAFFKTLFFLIKFSTTFPSFFLEGRCVHVCKYIQRYSLYSVFCSEMFSSQYRILCQTIRQYRCLPS